jgi:DNA polymerase-3 subunit beta
MISFSCNSQLISEAVSDILKTVSKSEKNVVGNGVKISLNENTLTLYGSSNSIEISKVIHVKGIKDGNALIQSDIFGKITKTLGEDEDITIRENDNRMRIQSGSARWDCNTKNVDEFPQIKDIEAVGVRIPKSAFKKLVDRTQYAVDKGEGKARYFTGINVEAGSEWIEVTASDGRRLSSQKFKITEGVGGFTGILPGDIIGHIKNTIDDNDVWISVDENRFSIKNKNTTIIGRLIEGRFPNWRPMIESTKCDRTFGVMTRGFIKAVSQAAITRHEESNSILFEFSEGSVDISGSREAGHSSVQFDLGWTHEDSQIRIDPDYLVAAIKPLEAETLNIGISNRNDSLLIRTEDGFIGMIMANVI